MSDVTLDPVEDEEDGVSLIEIRLDETDAGVRLDKALADKAHELSRARLQALMDQGAVSLDGVVLKGGSAKAKPGLYVVAVPALISAIPEAEDIALTVLF